MTVEPLRRVSGMAAVLDRSNVDTDLIIRIERMVSTNPADLAPWAFEALRYRPDGSDDPDFVLNQEPFRHAEILVTGPNFGCGSSREPAVWAIKGLGIRVIIAPSFGDIFQANCHQNGLLAVVLDESEIEILRSLAASGTKVTVDLEAQLIQSDSRSWRFAIGHNRRLSLLEGLDDLDLAFRAMDQIRAWETTDRSGRPWAWRPVIPAGTESPAPPPADPPDSTDMTGSSAPTTGSEDQRSRRHLTDPLAQFGWTVH